MPTSTAPRRRLELRHIRTAQPTQRDNARLVCLLTLLSGVLCAHGDHYSTLGVTRSSTPEDIRKAYRREALRWHPDKHVGAASQTEAQRRFEMVNEAWSALSDAGRRRVYDHESCGTPSGARGAFHTPDGYGSPFPDVVRVGMRCSLEQMGGWSPVMVTFFTTTGGIVLRRMHLPPGVASGKRVELRYPGCIPVMVRTLPGQVLGCGQLPPPFPHPLLPDGPLWLWDSQWRGPRSCGW
jgi:DnaJ family protein B protein 4